MSRRTWYPDAQWTSQGLVHCLFSFLTNDVNDPAIANLRGCGGLTGADAAGSVASGGPSAVASIARTGVGAYLITYADGYRYMTAGVANIDDAADALHARLAAPSNEGSGHTTAITQALTVRSAATATESTGRRVSVYVVFKNSGAGT
jgi:hypothetical protein